MMQRKPTFVYFMKPIGMDGPIKIGCSNCPETRLSTLAAWSPWPLEIAARTPGTIKDEMKVHGLFAGLHSHREWFRPSPELRAFIEKVAGGATLAELVDLNAPTTGIIRIRRKRALTAQRRLYLSYIHRFRHVFFKKPIWEPDDVQAIMSRWAGYYNQPQIQPTDAEIARLNEVLADPYTHGLTREQRFPPKEAA